MSDEPRRSGRATKGQHKNASSSPAPNAKPTKTTKSKPTKKSAEAEPEPNEDEPEEVIRCVCGNINPHDRRAFVSCDACEVWQHNVCMGVTDDEDELPEHYFCEQCRPEEHQETVQSIQRGERIWEQRNRMYQNEKKMSKSRKSKGRGEDSKPAWLKKDVPPVEIAVPEPVQEPEPEPEPTPAAEPPPAPAPAPAATNGGQEANTKRKRDDASDDLATPSAVEAAAQDEKPSRPSRQEKRRKSTPATNKAPADANTAIVPIAQLPQDRQKGAQALAKIIADDIQARTKSGYRIPDGQTASSLGELHAARIEYEMHMTHGVGQANYINQFRALHANLKKNKSLVQRLLSGSLTANELATMSTSDMASEELQRERAEMKEVLDRQVIAVVEEGPRYRQDHKGVHLIEDETRPVSAPQDEVEASAHRPSIADARAGSYGQSGSPAGQSPLVVDTSKQEESAVDRRHSSQQFDMKGIWAKAQQSPTTGTPPTGVRPMQVPARRRSSIPQNGAKDDPDVDRMLEDDDDSYAPADVTGPDSVVWKGKLVQSSEDNAPTVNARFVAGRDLASTGSWTDLLPQKLSIDGRLFTGKAEEYLCGLRWSSSSDVTVLSLSAYDNLDAFNEVFDYFRSRDRYAVVEKDKPPMVKDLYIIPVDIGENLPGHVEMLEHCTLKKPVEERLLLATLIVARAPEAPPAMQDATAGHQANGHLPPHVRQSIGGPAGSPINAQSATFSPPNNNGGFAAPPNALPPNPYVAQQQSPYPPQPQMQPHPNPLVTKYLGDMQFCTTAQQIFRETDPAALTEIQLRNLGLILQKEVTARTDFQVLATLLYAPMN